MRKQIYVVAFELAVCCNLHSILQISCSQSMLGIYQSLAFKTEARYLAFISFNISLAV